MESAAAKAEHDLNRKQLDVQSLTVTSVSQTEDSLTIENLPSVTVEDTALKDCSKTRNSSSQQKIDDGLNSRNHDKTGHNELDAGDYEKRKQLSRSTDQTDCSDISFALRENDHDGEKKFKGRREGFFRYVWSELSRGYIPDENEAAYNVKRERVYEFLCIPKECEKFMFYGYLQCVDSFLFIFTFLPLRLLIILIKLLSKPWNLCLLKLNLSTSQKCDMIKGVIIIAGCLLIHQVDASMVYHLIRGQAIIKLYIIFNLLDIGDKLLSSFGQDIMDSLMWAVSDSKRHSKGLVVTHVLAGVIYVFLHSMLVLLQVSALNVAFNSHSKALLTILISNNAVEVKGAVFKKFEKTNLFQMACSDVRERFHYQVIILIVCLRNMTDFNWDIAHLGVLIPDIALLLLSEMFVDVTKHAFITKFNNIPSSVFREYTVLLANDVITSRKKNAFSDVSDQVSRRLGLIPLPLACLLIKILYQCIKLQTPLAIINAVMGFILLIGAKTIIGIVVYGWAIEYWNAYRKEQTPAARRRHKSGLDQDLLKCENNLHWVKKPTVTATVPFHPIETVKSTLQTTSH